MKMDQKLPPLPALGRATPEDRSRSSASKDNREGKVGAKRASSLSRTRSSSQPAVPGLKRPVSYVCYLCGCQFGSQSLFIHIGRCQEKWCKKEALKLKRERRPLPPSPAELESCELPTSAAEIEGTLLSWEKPEFNSKMFSYFNTVSLCTCTTCGRSFNEEAFSKHVAKCGGGGITASPSGPAAKPLGYCCYICGQQYGSKSLRIHITSCQNKWEQRESVKLPRERRPVPSAPLGFDPGAPLPTDLSAIEEFNMRMFEAFNESSLCKCQHCGRTFNEEAFARHSKMCTAERPGGLHAKGGSPATFGGSPSRMAQGTSSSAPQQKPRAYACYLCGQQYGSQSLKIHVPKCQQKFENEQQHKAAPRPLPPAPPELDDPLPTLAADIDAFNEKMFEYYNNCSLTKCTGCGRSFHAEAYEKHVLRCPGSTPGAGPNSRLMALPAATRNRKGATFSPSSQPRTYSCYLCGQQFGSSSLTIHLKSCEAKWDRTEAQRPEPQRRTRPPPPPELLEPLPDTAADIDQFNSKMMAIYSTASLIPCPHCSRTFSENAWKNHRKICTAERPMKSAPRFVQNTMEESPNSMSQAGQQGFPAAVPRANGTRPFQPHFAGQEAPQQTQLLENCESCGRSFSASALDRHKKICSSVFGTKRKPMDSKQQRLKGVLPYGY